jgi:hypothetical protein
MHSGETIRDRHYSLFVDWVERTITELEAQSIE